MLELKPSLTKTTSQYRMIVHVAPSNQVKNLYVFSSCIEAGCRSNDLCHSMAYASRPIAAPLGAAHIPIQVLRLPRYQPHRYYTVRLASALVVKNLTFQLLH